MIETYNTILQEGQDEIVEKKSRFIGYAVPVSSEEEAYAFVEKIAPEECPICKEGKLPLVHLGSRKMKQEAKQTL